MHIAVAAEGSEAIFGNFAGIQIPKVLLLSSWLSFGKTRNQNFLNQWNGEGVTIVSYLGILQKKLSSAAIFLDSKLFFDLVTNKTDIACDSPPCVRIFFWFFCFARRGLGQVRCSRSFRRQHLRRVNLTIATVDHQNSNIRCGVIDRSRSSMVSSDPNISPPQMARYVVRM